MANKHESKPQKILEMKEEEEKEEEKENRDQGRQLEVERSEEHRPTHVTPMAY